MARQIAVEVKAVQTILAQVVAQDATVNGAAVDCQNFDEAMIVLDVGTVAATGTLDVKIQESVDSAFTSPLDITGAVFVQVTPSNDVAVFVGSLKLEAGRLQFIRAVAVDATAIAECGVVIHLANPVQRPAQTPAWTV